MIWEIPRCYDSHTHVLGTGIFLEGLQLFDLRSIDDLQKIKLKPSYFKGEWLVGFGWDHSKWGGEWPTAEALDRYFPDFPVAFSRADGHTTWLNSKALAKLGYFQKTETQKPTPDGGVILRDKLGFPTGIFQEHAKLMVDFSIPDYQKNQKLQFLETAIQHFLKQGFSHIRDMTGNIEQWNLLKEILTEKKFPIFIEQNFVCENLNDLARALAEIHEAKKKTHPQLRVGGIKVFYDGSLGSEGAYLSQNYKNTQNQGLLLWSENELRQAMEKAWSNGLSFCIHTIGDQAAHQAVEIAFGLHDQFSNAELHVEHAQILRPETIEILEKLNVTCHLQPCHYLSDRRWLKEKLGDLYSRAFPWRALQESKIRFQFGSDSPIERASVEDNFKALHQSAQDGIPELQGDWMKYHSHPDPDWGSGLVSLFENGQFKSFKGLSFKN